MSSLVTFNKLWWESDHKCGTCASVFISLTKKNLEILMTLYKRLLGSQIYSLNNNVQWNQQMLNVWCEEKVEHKNQVTFIISNI